MKILSVVLFSLFFGTISTGASAMTCDEMRDAEHKFLCKQNKKILRKLNRQGSGLVDKCRCREIQYSASDKDYLLELTGDGGQNWSELGNFNSSNAGPEDLKACLDAMSASNYCD